MAVATGLSAAFVLSAACFSQADWQQLQQQPSLLYVWSPRMVLSALHAHEVQAEAAALGLRWVAVHDHRLPAQEVAQALQHLPPEVRSVLQHTRPLCEHHSLLDLDAYRHFPTAWVAQQGRFHPSAMVSAMPTKWWRYGLQLRLSTFPSP